MFGQRTTYRHYLLGGLLLITAACNNNTPDIDALIEKHDNEALHQRRNEIQKELQNLQEKAQVIDNYFADQDNDQQTALVTIDTLKPTVFKHYIEVQGD